MIYINLKTKYDEDLKRAFFAAILATGQNEELLDVDLDFVSEKQIKELNKLYRNKDEVTDVLSFPFLNVKPKNIIQKENFITDFNIHTGTIFLGDVYICMKRAEEQAAEYGHSIQREVCYLFVHGLLHLLGYDHMQETDKKIMREKEEEILKILDIKREEE